MEATLTGLAHNLVSLLWIAIGSLLQLSLAELLSLLVLVTAIAEDSVAGSSTALVLGNLTVVCRVGGATGVGGVALVVVPGHARVR
jgi:hypothetical protein